MIVTSLIAYGREFIAIPSYCGGASETVAPPVQISAIIAGDGVWNEEGATLNFNVPPAWYQTTSVRFLLVLAVLFVAWSLYRLRLHQITASMSARFDERLAERTRMARELHDTFLQTVQGSKLVADDALERSSDPVRMHRALEQLFLTALLEQYKSSARH
jgi:signal transduction histidine kinase